MGLFDEIIESIGINEIVEDAKSRITIIDNKASYFEGVKGIKSYDKEEIILSKKKGEIVIKGKELYIKKLCQGDIAVCGKIESINLN